MLENFAAALIEANRTSLEACSDLTPAQIDAVENSLMANAQRIIDRFTPEFYKKAFGEE